MSPHAVTWLVLIPILGLLYYRRLRRFIGRQPIRTRRMAVRVALLAVVLLFFGSLAVHQPQLLAWLGGGAFAGALLGGIGLRLTRIEVSDEGDFYTPNTWLGMAVIALLIGRLVYKYLVIMPQMASAAGSPQAGQSALLQAYTQHPLTLLIYGLVIGYYLAYFGGLLVHHRRVLAAHRAGRAA